MQIAIIGYGIVGKATKEVLSSGHDIQIHDPLINQHCEYKNAEVVIICTPTSNVKAYLEKLHDHDMVFVRSTIPWKWVKDTNFAVWPEFLTERTWMQDAHKPICKICGGNKTQADTLSNITKFKDWFVTSNHIASLMKNSTNVFYAMKVTYANMLYQVCQDNDMDYEELARCIKQDVRMGELHWQVPGPDGKKGYGGKCFPENISIMKDSIYNDVLIEIERYNNLIRD